MIGNIDKYALCFCGSGKKYGFCCMKHMHELAAQNSLLNYELLTSELSEQSRALAQQSFDEGDELLGDQKIDQAIEKFSKSIELNPYFNPALNNLALCYQLKGDYPRALEILKANLKNSSQQNPFGLAQLAILLYITGQESAALNTVYIAANLPCQSPQSTAKVCEAMAYFKLHRDILKYIELWERASDEFPPEAFYFSAIAAANIGDYDYAISNLESLPIGYSRNELAQKTLAKLKNGEAPGTVYGNWPYFSVMDFIQYVHNLENMDKFNSIIQNTHWFTDFIETTIIDLKNSKERNKYIGFLNPAQSPSAEKLLRQILKWEKTDDKLCFNAVSILRNYEMISDNEAQEILSKRTATKNGRPRNLIFKTFKLDPEHYYGGELPPSIKNKFIELMQAYDDESPDYDILYKEFEKLSNIAPDYYLTRYYMAHILASTNKGKKAERIYRDLLKEHPDFICAASAILDIMLNQGRQDEAYEFIRSYDLPTTISPDAATHYFATCVSCCILNAKMSEAKQWLDFMKSFAPKAPYYIQAKQEYDLAKASKKIMKILKKTPSDML